MTTLVRSPSATVGRWLSIVGHPFILVPLAIVFATRSSEARGPVLTLVAISMVLIAVFVVRQLRRGAVTDVDVSTREHRPGFYALAIGTSVVSTVILYAMRQPLVAVRGAGVSAALLVVSAIANTKLKVSLHTAFALMAAGIAYNAGLAYGGAFLVAALAVAWARVAYGRHTRPEVIGGGALGILAALAQAWPI